MKIKEDELQNIQQRFNEKEQEVERMKNEIQLMSEQQKVCLFGFSTFRLLGGPDAIDGKVPGASDKTSNQCTKEQNLVKHDQIRWFSVIYS